MPAGDFDSAFRETEVQFDVVQQVHTSWRWDASLGIWIETIKQEGRAKNYRPGYNHICYSVASRDTFERIKGVLHDVNSRIVQLTQLEKSGSKQCDSVIFYYQPLIGIFELNIHD